jgi:hypothetical protein
LINAVNYAETGLSIVLLADGFSGTGSRSWTNPATFPEAELEALPAYFHDDSVVIPRANTGSQVNEGLTPACLSSWGISPHNRILNLPSGYLASNGLGSFNSSNVTLVTEAFASGGTTGCGI